MKAYAVKPGKQPDAPLEQGWSLYRPALVAYKLDKDIKETDEILQDTGFYKAVRVREELIRYRIRLQRDIAATNGRLMEIADERRALRTRMHFLMDEANELAKIINIAKDKPTNEANTVVNPISPGMLIG